MDSDYFYSGFLSEEDLKIKKLFFKKRACLVRATVEHELIVSYLELKNAIFLVLTLIKHSLGMSEQLSL